MCKEIGWPVKPEQMDQIVLVVQELLEHSEQYKNKIEYLIERYLYIPGRSGEAGSSDSA